MKVSSLAQCVQQMPILDGAEGSAKGATNHSHQHVANSVLVSPTKWSRV